MTFTHESFCDEVLKYQTDRLNVYQCHADINKPDSHNFFARIAYILTPSVVQNLPPYFQNINSVKDAELWFDRVLSEGLLFVVISSENHKIIGLLFIHIESDSAHIGYLLSEPYWGRGLATELLTGFIQLAATDYNWKKLIAGVEANNLDSSKLLVKLGFNPVSKPLPKQKNKVENQIIYYQYLLC